MMRLMWRAQQWLVVVDMEVCCDCVIAMEIEINGQTSCVGTA